MSEQGVIIFIIACIFSLSGFAVGYLAANYEERKGGK